MSNEIVWEIEYYEHSNDKQPFSEGEIETEFGDKLEWMSDKKSWLMSKVSAIIFANGISRFGLAKSC